MLNAQQAMQQWNQSMLKSISVQFYLLDEMRWWWQSANCGRENWVINTYIMNKAGIGLDSGH